MTTFIRTLAASVTGLLVLTMPAALSAWGMDVHRLITARALTGLPPELKPFYAERAAFIAEHAVDPDLWRVVALKSDRGDEDPNHFLHLDELGEPRPFTNAPRTWSDYVLRFGVERTTALGRLPWRTEEIYNLLVARFRDIPRGQKYAADNAAYLSAVVAHYIEDAHVPFHAMSNYDGQKTNQRGIHSRFENDVVLRFKDTWTLTPVTVKPVGNIVDFVFARLGESEGLADQALAADKAAAAGSQVYDDAYFVAFAKAARPVIERRLSDSASSVASVIVAAWTEAGKPALPVKAAKAPARINR